MSSRIPAPTNGATAPAHGGGPRTPEGRARSSRNALRHGLRSERFTLLSWESAEEYRALLAALVEDFAPVGALEQILVEKIASLVWRVRRAMGNERAEVEVGYVRVFNEAADQLEKRRKHHEMLARGEMEHDADLVKSTEWPFDGKDAPADAETWANELFEGTVDMLLRYGTSLENRLYRAIKELHRLQDRRAGRIVPSLEVTVDVRGDGGGEGELPNELSSSKK